MKIKPRWNFRQLTRFIPLGLDSFKIHRKFKCESVPKFITWPSWESYSKFSNIATCKDWVFLELGKASKLNLKLEKNLINWKIISSRFQPGPIYSTVPVRTNSAGAFGHDRATNIHYPCRTARPGALPLWTASSLYLSACGRRRGEVLSHFTSSLALSHYSLCSAPLSHTATLLTIEHHHYRLPSPSEWTLESAMVPSSHSTRLQHEMPASNAGSNR
jgi:hypothetical protein